MWLLDGLTRSRGILWHCVIVATVLIGADPVAGRISLLAKGVFGVLYPDAAAV